MSKNYPFLFLDILSLVSPGDIKSEASLVALVRLIPPSFLFTSHGLGPLENSVWIGMSPISSRKLSFFIALTKPHVINSFTAYDCRGALLAVHKASLYFRRFTSYPGLSEDLAHKKDVIIRTLFKSAILDVHEELFIISHFVAILFILGSLGFLLWLLLVTRTASVYCQYVDPARCVSQSVKSMSEAGLVALRVCILGKKPFVEGWTTTALFYHRLWIGFRFCIYLYLFTSPLFWSSKDTYQWPLLLVSLVFTQTFLLSYMSHWEAENLLLYTVDYLDQLSRSPPFNANAASKTLSFSNKFSLKRRSVISSLSSAHLRHHYLLYHHHYPLYPRRHRRRRVYHRRPTINRSSPLYYQSTRPSFDQTVQRQHEARSTLELHPMGFRHKGDITRRDWHHCGTNKRWQQEQNRARRGTSSNIRARATIRREGSSILTTRVKPVHKTKSEFLQYVTLLEECLTRQLKTPPQDYFAFLCTISMLVLVASLAPFLGATFLCNFIPIYRDTRVFEAYRSSPFSALLFEFALLFTTTTLLFRFFKPFVTVFIVIRQRLRFVQVLGALSPVAIKHVVKLNLDGYDLWRTSKCWSLLWRQILQRSDVLWNDAKHILNYFALLCVVFVAGFLRIFIYSSGGELLQTRFGLGILQCVTICMFLLTLGTYEACLYNEALNESWKWLKTLCISSRYGTLHYEVFHQELTNITVMHTKELRLLGIYISNSYHRFIQLLTLPTIVFLLLTSIYSKAPYMYK